MTRTHCFYRMTHDSGFAPNPFHGWCTLATCTPNHRRANLGPGDVLVGVESNMLREKRRRRSGAAGTPERGIVYYMEIEERLTLEDYFNDPRFAAKKVPATQRKTWTYIQKHGDNVYFKDAQGDWTWLEGHEHDTGKTLGPSDETRKDIHGNRVFIGRTFYYFGNCAIPLPGDIAPFVPKTRGMKYERGALAAFDRYVRDKAAALGKTGRVGDPIDSNGVGGHAEPDRRSPSRSGC